ncbi:tripartite tricarboxylate transporter TctB family protein [Diaphorobacter sp.]|uniref:tripartite tricarboxylate transporter TctB family protein n=1 Tax=Diaphorobacter sp. TaxID=1934310 RepID=UPI003D095AA6
MPELSSPPHSAAAPQDAGSVPSPAWQAAVGVAVVLVAVGMAFGALQIPADAGYGGVGPNFLPWACAAVLGLCGILLVREALTGGYRQAADPGGAARAALGPFAWVSAGLLLNAALITQLGFIAGCTLCYALAVQGLRRANGQTGLLAPRALAVDVLTGLAISAPVFWLFTQFLAINLPGLTDTGWL